MDAGLAVDRPKRGPAPRGLGLTFVQEQILHGLRQQDQAGQQPEQAAGEELQGQRPAPKLPPDGLRGLLIYGRPLHHDFRLGDVLRVPLLQLHLFSFSFSVLSVLVVLQFPFIDLVCIVPTPRLLLERSLRPRDRDLLLGHFALFASGRKLHLRQLLIKPAGGGLLDLIHVATLRGRNLLLIELGAHGHVLHGRGLARGFVQHEAHPLLGLRNGHLGRRLV
eukprot:scaffold1996_cov235-Pinguiococcus_pyrenoidosus.AAC.5